MSITHLYIIPTYRSFVKRFEENAAVGSAALTAVQGRHSLPSPFKSLFFTANKTKNSPMAVFALFGCGGSGARRNDRTVVNKVPFGTLEPYGDRARRREGFEPHVLAFSLRRKCCGQFGGSDLPPAGHSLPPHPPSYSPFGLITLSLCVHTLSQAKQKHMCNKLKFEKGFEFSRLAAARSGSALTAVQGCHSLPSPFKSLFFTASKTKNSPMGCFCFVWSRWK